MDLADSKLSRLFTFLSYPMVSTAEIQVGTGIGRMLTRPAV